MFYDEIVEDPLRIASNSWRIKSNSQLINPEGSVEVSEADCSKTTTTVTSSQPSENTLGQWEPWRECSHSCGSGKKTRSRCIFDKGRIPLPAGDFIDPSLLSLFGSSQCNRKETMFQACNTKTCEEGITQLTVPSIIEATTKSTDQELLNCKVINKGVSYTFPNGAEVCRDLGTGWRYPPSNFHGHTEIDIEGFWLGARLTGGVWVDEFNLEIPRSDLTGSLDWVSDDAEDLCLYSHKYERSKCDQTKAVVCCEAPAIGTSEEGKTQVTVRPNIQNTIKSTDQEVLNCRVISNEIYYTFHNGIARCEILGNSWRYPPSKFHGHVGIDIEGFWLGARLTGGEWVNEFNREIPPPDFIPDLSMDGDICLYWQTEPLMLGHAGQCDQTKPVVCCEVQAIETIALGKHYHKICKKI